MANKDTKRIFVTLEASKVDAILAAADDYGMSYSNFGGLCAWIGFKTMMRSIDPEKMLTVDQWVDIIEAAQKRGIVTDDEIKASISEVRNG